MGWDSVFMNEESTEGESEAFHGKPNMSAFSRMMHGISNPGSFWTKGGNVRDFIAARCT